MEFDAAGKLVSNFGGPGQGYDWPADKPADIEVDGGGNVWITGAGLPEQPAGRGGARGAAPAAAAGRGARGGAAAAPPPPPADAHVLKFSRDGRFLLQIGKPGQMEGPESRTTLNHPKGIAVDMAANEVYVADSGNRRIVVFDANTGAYKRHWGGTGERTISAAPAAYAPGAPSARGFRDVTCVVIGADNMVYVCDRMSNRIQVFQKDGTFVKEAVIAPNTLGVTVGVQDSWGSVWDLAFSNDAQQQFIFVADGHNKKVRILRRDTLAEVGTFGDGGRQPGRFFGVGSIAVDSAGNVYTGEDFEGKRVQKWVRR
jgi:DNA-binding beta-propeller fold protein YncE